MILKLVLDHGLISKKFNTNPNNPPDQDVKDQEVSPVTLKGQKVIPRRNVAVAGADLAEKGTRTPIAIKLSRHAKGRTKTRFRNR